MSARSNKSEDSVSVGRQPIFDERRKLWGYELFCVGDDVSTQTSVAINLQSSAYRGLQQITQAGKRVIVDFTERSILDNLPHALPASLGTIRVFEHVAQNPQVLESLTRLKSDGYPIAVEGFSSKPECVPLYELADIISIDQKDGAEAIDAARRYGASLLARRVQDKLQFKESQEMGFSLFHGPFFKSPDQITVRKLSSNEIVRFNLLRAIEGHEFEVARMAETIQADVTISFRLLAYLNSAAFAFSQKVKSVTQAITLLGSRNVKNWLRVLLLTDISQTKEAQEIVLLSAQRGLFLELVSKENNFWGFDPNSLHLLGLFSLLEALIGVPMIEIVAHLPLDQKMKSALCGQPNNEYLPLLRLAECFEETRWEDGERLVQQLNLDSRSVRKAFQTSIDWASDLTARHIEKASGA